ncbi:MAG: ABC transporter permease [Myxococcota bacterium]
MGYPVKFAIRYLGAKKRESISVGTVFAVLGVALGVAALATIMSVTGGFHQQFREKVLGVNAHVLVLKYTHNFREYREIMKRVAGVEGVVGIAPFSINPMMLTHNGATATGVLVKGVDPKLSLGVDAEGGDEWNGSFPQNRPVLDLPRYVVQGSLKGLRRSGAEPAKGRYERSPAVDLDLLTPPGSAAPPASAAPDPSEFLGGERDDDPFRAGAAPIELDGTPTPPDDLSLLKEPKRPELDDNGLIRLPDEDTLPPEVEKDPCEDPAAKAALPGIVVGTSLAENLKLSFTKNEAGEKTYALGDCVTVTSPTIGFSFSAGKIKPPVAKRFKVIAVFEAGFDQYDSKLVYTDLYEAQSFYDHGDTVTGVEMKVADIGDAGAISARISERLGSGLYHTMDWEQLNRGLFTALKIQQWAMSAVLALIIVVAAFTVIATLIMVVLDKQKEISVLKAMGATNFAILRVFLYQGAIIGFTGTALGLLLGFVVCKGLLVYGFPLDPKVYFISRLPVLVRPIEFIITGVLAIVICLFATIIPSLYAASLKPADGFRAR